MSKKGMRTRRESLAVVKLDLFFHDISLGHATGFMYMYGQSLALVSNWHVFSGRHPLTGEPADSRRYCPNRVDFHVNILTSDGVVHFRPESAKLTDGGVSRWWQHKGYKNDAGQIRVVDIGVLVLNDVLLDFAEIKDNIVAFKAGVIVNEGKSGEFVSFENAYARIGTDVFIIGFPKGLHVQGALPVWKRGSIASEPLFGILDDAPAMLVDGITRQGMSGSPVILLNGPITDAFGRSRGLWIDDGDDAWLLGVHSGRRGSSNEETDMTLGRVWHRRLLDEIFFNEHREIGGAFPTVEL